MSAGPGDSGHVHPAPRWARRAGTELAIVGLLVASIAAWNFWLPTARDFFSLQTKPPLPPNVDFFTYYTAGLRFERGENPYYWPATDVAPQTFTEYIYPPTFLPLFGLLSRLPYDTARTLWASLYGLAYLGAFLSMLWATRRDLRLPFLALSAVLTLLSFPLLFHIRNGQSDVFIISLLLVGYVGHRRGHNALAGVLLALATVAKVSPVFLLIYYVVYLRDRRLLLATLAALVSLFGISLIWVPLPLYPDYLLHVLPNIAGGTSYWFSQSLLRFAAGNGWLARGISAVVIGGFAWLAWTLAKRPDHRPEYSDMFLGALPFAGEGVFLLNLLVIVLSVGMAWPMTYVWMILPCALLLTGLLRARVRVWFLIAVSAAVGLMEAKVYGLPGLGALNLSGNLLLTACMATLLWKGPRWLGAEERVPEGTSAPIDDVHGGGSLQSGQGG
jgi:hypothetical protein